MQAETTLQTRSPEETAALATQLGQRLKPGDCLLLSGPIGAGKSHFCRSLIQALQAVPEDVPSPTFTLVQTYETTAGPIWHADLYRLSDAQEIEELGLAEAFAGAICLIEWPDRLGLDAPANALSLNFSADCAGEDARRIVLQWTDPRWADRLNGIAPHG